MQTTKLIQGNHIFIFPMKGLLLIKFFKKKEINENARTALSKTVLSVFLSAEQVEGLGILTINGRKALNLKRNDIL